MSSKQQRQQMVTRLIAHDNVVSQPHLQELLKAQGIEATQATISRDLEELGAVKIRIAGGDSIYAIAEYAPARVAPSDQFRRVMAEWVAEVTSSGNLVVVRNQSGHHLLTLLFAAHDFSITHARAPLAAVSL